MLKILHIAAHYGGGVGTVINSWVQNDKVNKHRITYLNTKVNNCGEVFKKEFVTDSDIVVCHIWNHPSLYDFLVNVELPPCRLIFWSHISGLFPPYTYFNKLIDYADRFIFTTPVSFDCKEIKDLPKEKLDKLTTIWSTCGVEKFKDIKRVGSPVFTVGITGTVDYGKLHKDFIEMCSRVKPDDIRFYVCSTDTQKHLIDKAVELGTSDRFYFAGKVGDVANYLPMFDVFGYPLHQTHYGSCEQALGEAMMCGCVPVVFNNPSEKYIVKSMFNGIVVNSIEGYCGAIEYLYNNREELNRMSLNAIASSQILYDERNTVNAWNKVFSEAMERDKVERVWSSLNYDPWMVYAISMGNYGILFYDYVMYDQFGDTVMRDKRKQEIEDLYNTNPMFYSSRKGSVRQYLDYFPNDYYLKEWEKLL